MVEHAPRVVALASVVAGVFRSGGRLFACGNGGSACDAMHLVEELVARYKRERPGASRAPPAGRGHAHLLEQRLRLRHAPSAARWRRWPAPATCWWRSAPAATRPTCCAAVRGRPRARRGHHRADGARRRRMRALCDEALVVPAQATERIQEGAHHPDPPALRAGGAHALLRSARRADPDLIPPSHA